jgi:hypothetical protein
VGGLLRPCAQSRLGLPRDLGDVPDERLVFAYQMTVAGKPNSASLATVEFRAEGQGTRELLEALAAELEGRVRIRVPQPDRTIESYETPA